MNEKASALKWEVSVVILVAVRDEYRGLVTNLLSGAKKWGWRRAEKKPSEIEGLFLIPHDDVLIRCYVKKLPEPSQGSDAASWVTTAMAERYKPHCIAMLGICAGDPQLTKYGDVVLSIATIRHDYGKLQIGHGWRHGPRFTHRIKPVPIEAPLYTRLLELFPKARGAKQPFKVVKGVISTCNQVTRAGRARRGQAFTYIRRNVVDGKLAADEDGRKIVALEMEAHSVAFAALNSKVPLWFVAKGVSDFADASKGKRNEAKLIERAVNNAFEVTVQVIKDAVVPLFLEQVKAKAQRCEEDATKHFRRGEIRAAAQSAKKAFDAGCRTQHTRRRYLHGLTSEGEHDRAREVLDQFESEGYFYDRVAREIRATMLWREGLYPKACKVLPSRITEGHRQLTYLRVMSELFREEDRARQKRVRMTREHFRQAKVELAKALQDSRSEVDPWWIYVSLYWIDRVLGVTSTKWRDKADDALKKKLDSAPNYGAARLYRLLLLAAADDKNEFKKAVQRDDPHIEVAVEAADMVYERLRVLKEWTRDVKRAKRLDGYKSSIQTWMFRHQVRGRSLRGN